MNFLWRKWFEKVIKGVITAFVAYVTGPKLSDGLAKVGIVVDAVQLQAGLWVGFTAAANYVKHQKWVPKELKILL